MSISVDSLPPAPRTAADYRESYAALRSMSAGSLRDDAALLSACRAYVTLGLAGPARDLLSAAGRSEGGNECAAALRTQLASAPSGRVPWSALQQRFESNWRALIARRPELSEHESAVRGLPRRHQLFQSLDGNFHLAVRDSDKSSSRWVAEPLDAKAAVAGVRLAHAENALFCGPYVVMHDRFGLLLSVVFERTRKMFLTFSPRIYVLEPDPAILGAALYVLEEVDPLLHERVELLIGEDCVARLAHLLDEDADRPVPEHILRLPSASEALVCAVQQSLGQVLSRREQHAQRLLTRLAERSRGRTRAYYARRFESCRQGGLRVLGMTSRFTTYLQHCMRDVQAAFERAGHTFQLVIEENDHDLRPPVYTAQAIDAFDPDLVFVIDHVRAEYPHVIPADVPYVCWIQDLLPNLLSPQAGASHGPVDFFIAPQLEEYVQNYGYPLEQGLAWTMATNEHTYSAERLPTSELESLLCDFSFVSNHSAAPRELHDEKRTAFVGNRDAIRLIDWLYNALGPFFEERTANACAGFELLLDRAVTQGGLPPPSRELRAHILNFYLNPVAERVFRHQALHWIADYCEQRGRDLHLYGRGWEQHDRFGRHARGIATNGRHLRAIYQASRVNLQIIGTGVMHQRLLDGIASGGFFLMRYTPSDAIHHSARQFVEAAAKYAIQPEVEYQPADVPLLAAAVQARLDLCGLGTNREPLRFSAARLAGFRESRESGYRSAAGAVFECYDEVSFASAEEFARRADRFLSDADAREALTARMRLAVLARFTYGALVNRLTAFVAQHLRG